jgi:hypothetical protein
MEQPKTDRLANLFGVPLGDLGWFSSLLVGISAGFIAFFSSTFVAIVSMLVYITVTGRSAGSIDFALSYRDIGFPIGVVVMALALAYLGTLWARRQIRRT